MGPVEERQDTLNLLAGADVENHMAISDETWGIKEFQRDKANQLEQFGINQDRQIADDKAATERFKLALRKGTDEILLSVTRYDSMVKSLLMDVREYAAKVELEQLDVERQRSILAITKEELHLKQVNAAIFLEYINKKMVEVEVVKNRVEAAKANVRAIMANIAAGEADIKLINAEIEEVMMEAEKAGLQADVATIYAQIMVKQLSLVKLDVGRAEIAAGFKYITSKLTDMLAIWDEKLLVMQIKTDLENALKDEMYKILAAEKSGENLKVTEQIDQRDVFTHTQASTLLNIEAEKDLKATLVAAREELADQRLTMATQVDDMRTWAQELLNTAHKWTYLNGKQWFTDITRSTEYITGG